MVEGVEVVVAGPGRGDLDLLERRHTRGQRFPDPTLELTMVDVQAVADHVVLGRRRIVHDMESALRPERQPVRIDDRRAVRQRRRAVDHEHHPLAWIDRDPQADLLREVARPGAGGIDEPVAGHRLAVAEPGRGDTPAGPALEVDDLGGDVLDAVGDGSAADRVQQHVRVEPAFALERGRRAGDAFDAEPRELTQDIVRRQDDGGNAMRLLERHPLPQRGQGFLVAEQQVAALDEVDAGRLAIDREQLVGLPQEIDAELRDVDVDPGRELLADRARRSHRGGIQVGRVLLDHEHSAPEAGLAGQEVGDGAADDGAPGNDDVVVLVHRCSGSLQE